MHAKEAVTAGYIDSLLAIKVNGIQTALDAHRAAAKQNVTDFYTILSQTMAAGGPAAFGTTQAKDTSSTQALYAALAESASSSGSDGADLSSLSAEELSLYGLPSGSAHYSDAAALYSSMLAGQSADEGKN